MEQSQMLHWVMSSESGWSVIFDAAPRLNTDAEPIIAHTTYLQTADRYSEGMLICHGRLLFLSHTNNDLEAGQSC
jgi:hypothetical protein